MGARPVHGESLFNVLRLGVSVIGMLLDGWLKKAYAIPIWSGCTGCKITHSPTCLGSGAYDHIECPLRLVVGRS